MCGLCGVSAHPLPPGRDAVVAAMMDRIRHRGPDGDGLVSGDGFALGHTRLAIIDIEGGQQPMQTGDGRYTLVYNGEIYNYLELRDELSKAGVEFRTRSDTEVLLELLVRYGDAALEKLLGMFAFAFHDAATNEILLARDHFGIKPLYYAETPSGELVFGSEIKALLAHPEITARRCETNIFHYLTLQLCLADGTLFDGIHKLEPGCLAYWNPDRGLTVRRYWDYNFKIDNDHTPSYFTDRLRELLEESVRIQLRSDVPVGAHLSGGLDSSVVSTLAARELDEPLTVFHGLFDDHPGYDESSYAKLVAKEAGAKFMEVRPTAEDFIADMPRLIYFMDEPAAGPGLFPQYHVSKLAAENVKVVLSGQGGDEIFGGYARYLVAYLEQALKGAIFETQEEGQHLVTLSSIIPNLPVLKQYFPMMQRFWQEDLFDSMDVRYFRLLDRSPDFTDLVEPEFNRPEAAEAVFSAFQKEFNHPDTPSYINKMTHFDAKTLLPALLQVEDRVSMAVSLESRVPLLDPRIVDLVTTVPPPIKFAGGRTKHLLKETVRGLIPEAIVDRKDKMGFPVPLAEWMRKGPVRDFVSDILLSDAARSRGVFRADAVERLIRSEAPFGRQIWGALCLELWHQIYVDGTLSPVEPASSIRS